jgi:hypothetical protein
MASDLSGLDFYAERSDGYWLINNTAIAPGVAKTLTLTVDNITLSAITTNNGVDWRETDNGSPGQQVTSIDPSNITLL